MRAHVLLILFSEFNKFNNTRARMLDSIYRLPGVKTLILVFCHYVRNVVMDVITFPVYR